VHLGGEPQELVCGNRFLSLGRLKLSKVPVVSILTLGLLTLGVLSVGASQDLFAERSTGTVLAMAAPETSSPAQPAYSKPLPKLSAIDFDPRRLTPAPGGSETAVAEIEAAPVRQTATISGSSLNIRATPGTDGAVSFSLPRGVSVNLIESQGGWSLVETSDGRRGWAFDRYLQRDATSTELAQHN